MPPMPPISMAGSGMHLSTVLSSLSCLPSKMSGCCFLMRNPCLKIFAFTVSMVSDFLTCTVIVCPSRVLTTICMAASPGISADTSLNGCHRRLGQDCYGDNDSNNNGNDNNNEDDDDDNGVDGTIMMTMVLTRIAILQ